MNRWLKNGCFISSVMLSICLLFSLTACGPRKENGMYDETEYRQYKEDSVGQSENDFVEANGADSNHASTQLNQGDSQTNATDAKKADEQAQTEASENALEKDSKKESKSRDSNTTESTKAKAEKNSNKKSKKDSFSNAKSTKQNKKNQAKKNQSNKNTSDQKTNSVSQTVDTTQVTEKTTTESVTEAKALCSLTIECSTILNNKKKLKKGKDALVPANGIILQNASVEIQEGDTVMDILIRELKANGIALEYSYSPAYKTDYVEGINNLYQMDCGSLSGWMYEVNGTFPNYGASAYKVQDGDKIGWHFTCNGGSDVR